MKKIIDIHSKGEYPSNVLSNFYPNEFTYCGVKCASMEGFLQSLKYKNKEKQVKICSLVGIDAKNKGKKKWLWKITGNVYWQGKKYKRNTNEFKWLVLKAYRELLINDAFSKAIEDSFWCAYIHSIGKDNKRKTILTKTEFIYMLNKMRSEHLADKYIVDINTLIEIADKGDAMAQFWLACKYKRGDEVEKNAQKAFEYYYLSAKQGEACSALNLGHYYFAGEPFVKQNIKKAIELYKYAGSEGKTIAYKKLADIYGALDGRYNKKKAKYYQKLLNEK